MSGFRRFIERYKFSHITVMSLDWIGFTMMTRTTLYVGSLTNLTEEFLRTDKVYSTVETSGKLPSKHRREMGMCMQVVSYRV